MAQDKDGLMTVEDFNLQVNKWAVDVAMRSRQTLKDSTHGTGNLARFLVHFMDKRQDDGVAYKVKFHFDTYGVFRAYGAGRGYVILNGQIVRGRRVRSYSEIKRKYWNTEASQMLQRGYSVTEINKEKKYDLGNGNIIRRSRLDWIDHHIQNNIEHLADVCQAYYGDDAVRQILRDLDKMKIIKKS